MGRPSSYTQEIADEICERLSKGEPLAQICRDDHMPGLTTVYDWQKAHEEFSESFACARVAGFDQIAMDTLMIADTPQMGEIVVEKPIMVDGKPLEGVTTKEVRQEDMLGHRKLQVETRLKLLAKWDPKRYGDLLKLSGADGEGPVPVVSLNADMTATQAAEAYAKLLG
jgi:hypothetical protein